MDKYIEMDVDRLIAGQENVRDKHSKEDIMDMSLSIQQRGIINAPCISKNGHDKYEIVAGLLRTLGAQAGKVKTITCKDVTDLSEAEKIELSLSENIDRVRMTDVELFKAFAKLYAAGRTVDQIASHFQKERIEVERLLAIGTLPKKLLHLAETSNVEMSILRALAVAGKPHVTRFMKLAADKRPQSWQINEWIRGNDGWYRASAAIFDLELYKGGIVTDMFEDNQDADNRWLTDGAQFLELQETEIEKTVDALKDGGWDVVKLDNWQPWAYERTSKAKGGKVFYDVNSRTGEVGFHKGYKRPAKAGKEPAAQDNRKKEEAPEISQAFDVYCRHLRHNAVRAELIDSERADNCAALAVAIVLILKSRDNFNVRQLPNAGVKSDAYIRSIVNSQNWKFLTDEFKDVKGEVSIKKLLEYEEKDLFEIFATVIAGMWHMEYDDSFSKEVAKALGVTQVDHWEADDAFWSGIKTKKTLLKIAKENKITLGPDAKVKAMQARLKDKVPEDWRPKWLKF